MKILVSSASRKTRVNNIVLEAAICKECGARIYPTSALKSHLEYHEHKRQEFLKLLPRGDQDMDEAS